ncbi:MAG: hypothetical protein RXO43_01330 [Candidatus Micrarchaeota archaeon]
MEKTPAQKQAVYNTLMSMAKELVSSGKNTIEIKNMKIIGYRQYEERVMLITDIPQGSDKHYHVVIYTNSEKVEGIIKAIENKRKGNDILISGKFKILLIKDEHGERINFKSNEWEFKVVNRSLIPLDAFISVERRD